MEVRVRERMFLLFVGKNHATKRKSPFYFRERRCKRSSYPTMRRSPNHIFNFDLASQSSSSSYTREHRIFQFDEASLNSTDSSVHTTTVSSVHTTTVSSGQTIIDGSNTSTPSLNGMMIPHRESTGIFEDHPGLNPTDERIVDLQGAIREEMQKLMTGRDDHHIIAAAERIHAESDSIEFLWKQLQDLKNKGIESEAFRVGVVDLPNEVENFAAMNLAESPLDQFCIHPILDLHMGNFYFSFTNSSLFMLLTLGLVLLLVFLVTKKGGGKLVPNAWQSMVELICDFVLNLVNEQIGGLSGNVKQKYFPCILVTFTFLLFCNLQGMIPFSFTVTSHFLITLALSFSIFIGITIVGFQRHGLHFFSFLLPAGVPLPLAPFLVLLELISYCFRALSLGIRLFANMMAGHSLVKILSGFAWTMLFLNNIFYFIGDLGPLFIVLALTGLELGVAILQAYVFTILICIYLNDAINLH